MTTKVPIAFYSRGGVTEALAKAVAAGAEVRPRGAPLECRNRGC
jgi:hypothetical protein